MKPSENALTCYLKGIDPPSRRRRFKYLFRFWFPILCFGAVSAPLAYLFRTEAEGAGNWLTLNESDGSRKIHFPLTSFYIQTGHLFHSLQTKEVLIGCTAITQSFPYPLGGSTAIQCPQILCVVRIFSSQGFREPQNQIVIQGENNCRWLSSLTGFQKCATDPRTRHLRRHAMHEQLAMRS